MIHYTMSISIIMHLFPKYTGQYFSNYSISTKYGSEDLSIWRAISDSVTRQLRKYKPQRDGYRAIVIISILLRTAASR